MNIGFVLGFSVAALVLPLGAVAEAETPGIVEFRTPFEGSYGGAFGGALDMAGGRVLIGAPLADPEEGGAAALYDGLTGELLRLFENPAPAYGARYGDAVALSGSHAVIGAYGEGFAATEEATGAIYVYGLRDEGAPMRIGPPEELEGHFGSAVAVSDIYVLVGAPRAGEGGRAALFDLATGALVHTFGLPEPAPDWGFGSSVSLSDRYAVIYASGDLQVGEVHVFDVMSGDLVRTILDPTPDAYSDFGRAMALEGERLLLGASEDEDHPTGAAFLYEIGQEDPVAVFADPWEAEGLFFGASVALEGVRVAVAAIISEPFELGQPRPPQGAELFVFDAESGDMIGWHRSENESHFGGGYDVAVDIAGGALGLVIRGSDAFGDGQGAGFVWPDLSGLEAAMGDR